MNAGAAADFHRLCRMLSPFSQTGGVAAALPGPAGWQPLIAMADRQYVLSELHPVLRDHGLLDRVPAAAREMLEACFDIVVGRNADLRAQLGEITTLLAGLGIVPVWLKGAVYLTEPGWTGIGRIMGDLDFWVPDLDQQRATLDALEREGYRGCDGSDERVWRGLHHYGPRYNPDKPAQVEIHRHIVRPAVAGLLPDGPALAAVVRRDWQGLTIAHLCHDDRIMHSLVQCTVMSTPRLRRGRPRLMKYLDLARLMAAGEGPALPPAIVARIGQPRWRSIMARFLTFAAQDLGLDNSLETDRWLLERIDLVFARGGRLPRHLLLWELVRRRLLGLQY